jgi:LmbE family N-acetylglucosaminyl deacetylase
VCASDPSFGRGLGDPFRVSKLYYLAWSQKKWTAYQAALKKLVVRVDGQERQATAWPDWAITTVIDTESVWPVVWRAVSCHKTQMSIYGKLADLPEEYQRSLWGTQEFYRVFSNVNGGRAKESDVFEGLR